MPTISAVIKYATNVEELRRELKAGTDQLVVLEKAAERTVRNLGGEGLIRAAHNAAAAVQQLGGATKLTGAEQDKVNSLLTRAIEKYAALGKEAPAALYALQAQTSQLVHTVEPLPAHLANVAEKATLASKASGLLTSAFGQFTLAGLATSAIQKLGGAFIDFAKKGEQLPAIETSFKRLSSGLKQDSEEMLAALRDSTLGLVADLDLMQTANKAMLLGLPVTTDSMGELAHAATVLGRAMGQDATKSLDDLITALGRSSPMILDNLGLTVKVGEANEAYARSLHKSSEELTDAEKKMAFYNAAMEAARKKTAELGEQELTATEIGSIAWTKFGNVVTVVFARANEDLGRHLNLLKQIREDADRLGISFENIKPPKAPAAPQVRIGATPIELDQKELDEITEGLNKQREALDDAAKKAIEHANAIRALADSYSGLAVIKTAKDALEAVNLNLKNGITIAEMTEEQQRALNKTVSAAIEVYKSLGREAPESLRRVQLETQKIIDIQEDAKRALDDWSEEIRRHNEEYKQGEEETVAFLKELDQQRIDDAKAALDDYAEVVRRHQEEQKQGEEDTLKALQARNAEIKQSHDALIDGFDQVGRVLGSVGSAFDNLFGRITSGASAAVQGIKDIASATTNLGVIAATVDLGAMIGKQLQPLLGLRHGKLGELLGTNASGRQEIIDFANTFENGFEGMHAALLKLGDAGEAMWIKLTQGIGRADAKGALAAIQEAMDLLGTLPPTMAEQAEAAGFKTQDALQKTADQAVRLWEYMRDSGQYSAAAVQAAWERAQQALIAAGDPITAAVQKAKDAVADLDAQISSLNQSIANEAPEEEMGIIERNTRAQIASLEAQREEAARTLEALTTEMTDSIHEVADAIRDLPKEIEILIHAGFTGEIPEPGRSTEVSTGGYVGAGGILRYALGGVVPEAQHFGRGGIARFIPRGTDTIPAMLSPGEGIASVRGMSILGRSGLAAINAGRLPSMAFADTANRMPLQSVTVLELDKREFARAMADVLPGELRRLGVRVQAS